MKLSGFSFVHDGIIGGYPFVEAIQAVQPYVDEVCVVDMESTDGTREILEKLGVRIFRGEWGNEAGKTLALAHSMNVHCEGDLIVHFEADEVYDSRLLQAILRGLDANELYLSVYRLQIEQNFQRCRWYPEPVHRVFPRGSVTKDGHTTNRHSETFVIPSQYGYLWDCTNCFRGNWVSRIEAQAELWNEEPKYRMVPLHMTHPVELSLEEAARRLSEDHWTWQTSPFDLPESLKRLVGRTKYEVEGIKNEQTH